MLHRLQRVMAGLFGERLGLYLRNATWKAFASVSPKDGKTELGVGIFDIFAEIQIDATTPTDTWAMMFCIASISLHFNAQMANMRKLKKGHKQVQFGIKKWSTPGRGKTEHEFTAVHTAKIPLLEENEGDCDILAG